ncbi:Metal-sulfur cluster biosynthetic enzyme [Paenibacillus uliginis N3/975]|uniref:Metal-sulfur cluster biosynthetic enzyme n=1 Tax=Paenibacillus uliginis N3/975 TaxID=1313296 RepID=A0A1X7HPN8_9BACL|nr:metal-sulfur cluster assembly factor [Paenibacillus uliginis]SMF90691.1 Metal-sulfur cluster biosynthetic enzyme [Paenibacillus uliginis N3/975]
MLTIYSDAERMERIVNRLREVYDPELGINIVDLGLVYEVRDVQEEVYVAMTLTTPGCPMHDMIVSGVKSALSDLPNVADVHVQVVWEPQWTPEMMSDEAKAELGY